MPSLADPELARTYLTTHSSGLNVLAAPARPEADFRVTLEHLQRIIELMQPSFDHILVDLGSRLDPRAVCGCSSRPMRTSSSSSRRSRRCAR